MGVLFEDDFLDGFGTWPLAYIPYGGPDFGELLAVAQTVGRGDTDAYYAARFGERAIVFLQLFAARAEQRLRSGSKEESLRESAPSVRWDLSNTNAEPIGPTGVTDRDRACERDRFPAIPAAIGLRRRLTHARSRSRDRRRAGPAGNSARP
jgi:hypothetical protein